MTGGLTDALARTRIAGGTDATLFVEAGAGSGKTTSLVARLVNLVVGDGVPLASVAAVTFTEKAGAELRDRLRGALERDGGERARAALDDLDSAAIGTLHSFAQRILAEHAVSAGLPPLVEIADELSSEVGFAARWAQTQQALLDDEAMSDPFALAEAAGVKLDDLRALAKAFNSEWDLVADRVLAVDPPAPATLDGLEHLAAQAAELAARASDCTDPDDKFLPRLTAVAGWGESFAAARGPEERLGVLRAADGLRTSWGKGGSWGSKAALDALKAQCSELKEAAALAAAEATDATVRILARWIAERVLADAEARKSEGRLEFHDLLVLSRELVRGNAVVCQALQERYPRILLDEFQDTDPIQIELAVRIAGGAASQGHSWEDVAVPPGSLFVVGDPKQSIYRFRRADVATYLRAQDELAGGAAPGELVRLTTNFRSTSPVIDWVNATFARLITGESGVQPSYTPLDAHRSTPPGADHVRILGAVGHTDSPTADVLREREAADVAATVRRAIDDGWQVGDGEAPDGTPLHRDARLDDVVVLVPARTSLPFLEDALDEAGVPYRAESSSLVYQAQEVRDLLAAARAVADPSDRLSLVTALRSPLFGCGDDDLWTWKRDGGAFSVTAPPDDDRADHPVARSLAYLRRLHHASRWLPPSEVLGTVVADRRMFEAAAGRPRARDSWRRLRFVVDQARAWSESEHGGLRAYLQWAALQGSETSRVAEASLPETDTSAVRIMTVHAAKGLEFPIAILSGMTARPRVPRGVRVLWPRRGGFAIKLRGTVTTDDFDAMAPVDEQMDDRERRRLLYVAATRACDHLVVSCHRAEGSRTRTSAALLAEDGDGATAGLAWDPRDPDAGGADLRVDPPEPAPLPPRAEWDEEMARVRAASARPSATSASGLEGTDPDARGAEPGEVKGAVDVELPPWSKGRYGTAIGRAVHAVLQAVDLRTGHGLDDAVRAQCVAEGVADQAAVVTALVRSALDSELVASAAAARHWREMYVGTGPDGDVTEGFVDLVYLDSDGRVVVVDYKTDAVPEAALGARAAFYTPQLQAYARMLAAATGRELADAQLLFLHPERPGRAVAVPVT